MRDILTLREALIGAAWAAFVMLVAIGAGMAWEWLA